MYVNKWSTFSVSVICNCSAGLAYCFSLYSNELKNAFGYDQTQIQAVGSATNLGGYLSILSGLFYDHWLSHPRLGPRLVPLHLKQLMASRANRFVQQAHCLVVQVDSASWCMRQRRGVLGSLGCSQRVYDHAKHVVTMSLVRADIQYSPASPTAAGCLQNVSCTLLVGADHSRSVLQWRHLAGHFLPGDQCSQLP